MTQLGQVSAYNEKTGIATITYARLDACEKCGACGGAPHNSSIELKANCKVGDWVRVDFPEKRFLQASLMAYTLPLLCLLIGLVLGNMLGGGHDGWTLAGGGTGLAVCVVLLRLNEHRIAGKDRWRPHIAEVYQHNPTPESIGCPGSRM